MRRDAVESPSPPGPAPRCRHPQPGRLTRHLRDWLIVAWVAVVVLGLRAGRPGPTFSALAGLDANTLVIHSVPDG